MSLRTTPSDVLTVFDACRQPGPVLQERRVFFDILSLSSGRASLDNALQRESRRLMAESIRVMGVMVVADQVNLGFSVFR